jgi:hypothetical protein
MVHSFWSLVFPLQNSSFGILCSTFKNHAMKLRGNLNQNLFPIFAATLWQEEVLIAMVT